MCEIKAQWTHNQPQPIRHRWHVWVIIQWKGAKPCVSMRHREPWWVVVDLTLLHQSKTRLHHRGTQIAEGNPAQNHTRIWTKFDINLVQYLLLHSYSAFWFVTFVVVSIRLCGLPSASRIFGLQSSFWGNNTWFLSSMSWHQNWHGTFHPFEGAIVDSAHIAKNAMCPNPWQPEHCGGVWSSVTAGAGLLNGRGHGSGKVPHETESPSLQLDRRYPESKEAILWKQASFATHAHTHTHFTHRIYTSAILVS